MDRERFDALARLLGRAGSRRAALGVVVGAAVSGSGIGLTAQAKKGKKKKKKKAQPQTCFGTLECAFPSDGQDFENCNLAGTVIESCDGCNFRGADLSQTDLSGDDEDPAQGRFQGVSFRNANLSSANLEYSDVSGASFRGACLAGANFYGANTDGADFRDAIFCGTVLTDGTVDDSGCDDGNACCFPPPPPCLKDKECADGCSCEIRVPRSGNTCVSADGGCDFPCGDDADCQADNPGWVCVDDFLCEIGPHCHPPCSLANGEDVVEVTRKSGRRSSH